MITAQKGLNEPRYPSLKGIMSAKNKPIEEKVPPSGVEAEPLVVQMVVKMAVPGRTIQEFCTAGAAAEPAKAK